MASGSGSKLLKGGSYRVKGLKSLKGLYEGDYTGKYERPHQGGY